ncbi:MAG TPA: hypothetical protein PJ993_02140 [Candidatus Saccharibacteria bacterium]|nr:hypothetical protein [Candidatus Saccharibacteria bacterium]HMT39710.1 hypothetical protein [Candidatus Saccharibacteria bacterium]
MTTNTALDWIPPGTFGPDDISEQLELDLTEEKGPERPVGRTVRLSNALSLTIELRFRKVR